MCADGSGQGDTNDYNNSNVISLCQGEPYVHGKLALQQAKSLLLWPIKGQSVDRSQAELNMNHSALSDRIHEHRSPESTGQNTNTSKQTNNENDKQPRRNLATTGS